MRYHANMAVRLRATSELLLVDSIDEEAAIAFCRRIGASGPEGTPLAYPLDSLRENVIRASRAQEMQHEPSTMRKLCCALSLHGWTRTSFGSRPPLGSLRGWTCVHCGDIRVEQGEEPSAIAKS